MFWNETSDDDYYYEETEHNGSHSVHYSVANHFLATMMRISPLIYYFSLAAGTVLNLWFLVAILRSPQNRSRFRNKMICSMFVLNLIEILAAIVVDLTVESFFIDDECLHIILWNHLLMVLNFIGNWQIVVIFGVFLAQTVRFDPLKHLSASVVKAGVIALVMFPWLISILVVPVITHTLHRAMMGSKCMSKTKDTFKTLKSFDTIFPILLAILLLLIAVYIRKKRSRNSVVHEIMQEELVGQNLEPEGIRAYVAAVIVVVVCDLLELIWAIDPYIFYNHDIEGKFIFDIFSNMLSGLRVVLIPFPWLLLPDIGERLRTWIPWGRPTARDEQSVRYQREEA